MCETTQEQKDKYLNRMREIRSTVTEMVPKINSVLVGYGAEYYRNTKGEYTASYFRSIRAKAEEDIKIIAKDKFTEIIDSLAKAKEDYIDQCFEKKTTTDPVELNFVSKELELMSREELQEFLELNYLDKNMVRLFDIEVKRRIKSNEQGMSTQGTSLQNFKENFTINDQVIKTLDECIKEMTAARSVSGSTLFFPQYDEYDNMTTKSVTYAELFNYIHGKCAWGAPSKDAVNILDISK
ncbi:hypothetical protein [Anaerosporobacter faecicola]|uniref:hypothetical protein n=1 Tax=Anaerosporobacter faecicola TaxID=2718714 RepID=UPI001438E70A|nr:hypothetical protein [Anaerosporobacter faecicola]